MQTLGPEDRRRIEAAQGWGELQDFEEAAKELGKVSVGCQDHPDVLEVRWQICVNRAQWEAALDLAGRITRKEPGAVRGYLYTASSLVGLGRPEKALTILLQAVQLFPRDEIVLYDLACICCGLGQLADAKAWLSLAVEIGGDDIRKRAIDDPDLEALW